MRDLGPGGRGGESAAPGVGKKIEHTKRPTSPADLRGEPLPIVALLGKEADLARLGQTQFEPHRPRDMHPRLGEWAIHDPCALVARGAFIASGCRGPGDMQTALGPLRGWRGTIDHASAEQFQFAAAGEIEQFVIFVVRRSIGRQAKHLIGRIISGQARNYFDSSDCKCKQRHDVMF